MKKLWKSFAVIMAALLLFAGCNQNAEHVHMEDNGTVTTEATCTEPGVKTYKCTECGEITRTEEIAATGHYEDEGTVTRSATITSAGVITYCCSKCEIEIRKVLFSGPLGEDGNVATSSSTYVYFGVFPKTVAYQDDAGKIYAADKTTEITIDETTSVTMGGSTYYKGSDGEYYAKVTENGYGEGYTYTDGTEVNKSSANSTRYFKVEPIKWKVLTTNYNSTGNALLLAEDILTANVQYYCGYSKRRVGTDTKIYENNYKYSQIRAYLNGLDYYNESNTAVSAYSSKGFLQTAFTENEQRLIATTIVDNSAASTTDAGGNITQATSYYCADTQDKIFLLSEKEATTTSYGFAAYNVYKGDSNGTTESSRIRVKTDYAKANYAFQSTKAGSGSFWWLRSPYYGISYYARTVLYDGDADIISDVNDSTIGIVPALTISLE